MAGNARRHGKGSAGFTLLELSCAIFILTIGVFGVIEMFYFGLNKVRALSEADVAMRAVQNEVEVLRGVPFAELGIETTGFRSVTPETERLMNATPEVRIEDAGTALKKVVVSIAWTGENGRRVEKGVTTLIADKGF